MRRGSRDLVSGQGVSALDLPVVVAVAGGAVGKAAGWKEGAIMAKHGKVHKVMHEFKEGKLHSGSRKGPVVRSKKQAMAIAMSDAGKSRKKKRPG